MKRSTFIKTGSIMAASHLIGMTTLRAFETIINNNTPTERIPAMFIGHGNPMNAIEDNFYHKSWQKLGKELPKPKAILSISAHWLTAQTKVNVLAKPRTIHDFGGFPKKLFDQEYPANGSPEYAKMVQELVNLTHIQSDESWGLDHGTWSVLLPMYPLADVPVFQLSLVYEKSPTYHYELGVQLNKLRDKGVMIIGSGNMVHNLAQVDWEGTGKIYDWAHEFDSKITEWLNKRDITSILDYQKILGKTADLAHPSYDHFLPLFYILGMMNKTEQITYFNEKFDMGSISMRSFIVKE